MEISKVYIFLGNLIYPCQAAMALWGAWCTILVFRRVRKMLFKSEDAQVEFLTRLEEPLARHDFQAAAEECENDRRVIVNNSVPRDP